MTVPSSLTILRGFEAQTPPSSRRAKSHARQCQVSPAANHPDNIRQRPDDLYLRITGQSDIYLSATGRRCMANCGAIGPSKSSHTSGTDKAMVSNSTNINPTIRVSQAAPTSMARYYFTHRRPPPVGNHHRIFADPWSPGQHTGSLSWPECHPAGSAPRRRRRSDFRFR